MTTDLYSKHRDLHLTSCSNCPQLFSTSEITYVVSDEALKSTHSPLSCFGAYFLDRPVSAFVNLCYRRTRDRRIVRVLFDASFSLGCHPALSYPLFFWFVELFCLLSTHG